MKKLIIFLFFTLFLFSCEKEKVEETKKYFWTWTVFSWSIDNFNTHVWYLQWQNTTNLSTKVWWKVTNIFVKEGDYVNAWDLLLTLDSMEAKVWYNTSSTIVSTLSDMKNTTSSMYDEQIKSMEQKLNQAWIWKEWVYTWLSDVKSVSEAQLETAKTSLETAKVNLENTQIILDTKEKNIYNNSKNAIVSSVILDTNIINFVDELLWVTSSNKDKNDSFEDYLSIENKQKLNEAETSFLKSYDLYKKYKELYNTQIENKNPSNEVLIEALNSWEILAENLKTLLNLTYDVLDNSVDNIYFSRQTIDLYKQNVTNFWAQIESSLITVSWEYFLWLKWSKQSLTDFQNEKKLQLEILKKQVELAEKSYNQYKLTSDSKIRETETQTKIVDSQLQEMISTIESLKKQKQAALEQIDLKISEAVWQKESSSVMIDSWEIRSPISWVITIKAVEIWQVVWWWMPLLVVADDKNLKLDISVSEEVLWNISLWQDVLLEVDWFDKQVKSKVSMIYPSKDLITKNTKIEIAFENKYKLKIGSYTKVYLSNIINFDSILIPNNSIVSKFMIPWVYVLNNEWKVEFKNIEIIKSNDKFSSISWLKVGDIIITEWKDNLYDGEKVY